MTEKMKFAFLQEPPFCFTDASGDVSGCDVRLAQKVCNALGLEVFSTIETEFAKLLPGLAKGEWDMTTGLFVSDERKKSVDFTRPIWVLQDGLLVAKGNPREFSGYRSIAGDETALIAVISGQVQHQTALQNGVPPERIRIFATQAGAADAVAAGAVHAYASVAMAHRGYLAQHFNAPLAVIDVPAAEKQPAAGAFALAKDNAILRQRIDSCLDDLLGTPWHRDMMAEYGFSDGDIDRLL
ncbi:MULTISPECIES: transporter substrate-binding domain-containing protein [unclassified Mesorhizobium]|uniref:transporter substrate-binding domain-containing protein n=1 Tax=unclassified Mesorhizobium TaxID=325217 RepID=UPI000F75ABE2|nr:MULTISPECIES: transporter substrate-binding domain-containing protein [unclassified Mesorhizobium]AZO68844.1 transporter substrate-binding domain-containing protein [Mesorhizobium sp. M6A.T.Cr.TU.016.01.1.1]RWP56814.1 MAG: transporter substrate-binding domain-containing protein [Mesorhizobium sp.]RWQ87065.1 MAG: transporter substrate-binding domain-containing protein [Mesorhizobium sp.]